MPQLELINWIFNFFMIWSFFIVVFSILINSLPFNNPNPVNSNFGSSFNTPNWYWN